MQGLVNPLLFLIRNVWHSLRVNIAWCMWLLFRFEFPGLDASSFETPTGCCTGHALSQQLLLQTLRFLFHFHHACATKLLSSFQLEKPAN